MKTFSIEMVTPGCGTGLCTHSHPSLALIAQLTHPMRSSGMRSSFVFAAGESATLDFRSLWGLDQQVQYLNHGSFGACPTAVLAAQGRLRLEMESEPVDFLSATLPTRLRFARSSLAQFLGADEQDLVFVPNATAGVNAVLRSPGLRSR